jgi:hypothetical protein
MKSLLEFKSIVEEEKSDYSKFDTLVRAGLANKAQMQRIHKILDKMGEDRPQFNNADRMIIQNLFNKMVDLISNNKAINMQARRAVKEDEDFIETDHLDEAQNPGPTPPYVLLLKRKAIRLYPDGTKIALYYNKQINKFFSVPYDTPTGTAIQAEEVEHLDEISAETQAAYSKASHKDRMTHAGNLAASTGQDSNAAQKLKVRNAGLKRISDRIYDKSPKVTPAPKTPLKTDYGYGKGRYMGDSVELQGNKIEEAVMDQLHKIVNDKQSQSVKFASGHTRKIDHFTASALTQVHKALNDDNKKKFADLVHKSPEHFMKASDFAFKHAK